MSRDFIFGTDGHAGLTNRKAGELLKVSRDSVGGMVNTHLVTHEEREAIKLCGIRGDILKKLCVHYSNERRISPQARQHCQDLLKNTEDFQALIDEFVNSGKQPQQVSPILDIQPQQAELAPPQEPVYQEELSDFVYGSDGHAGLSQRKAAELLKVNQSMISRLLRGYALFSREEAESITAQGFRGYALIKLAKHFSQAARVNAEVKRHCLDLLEKAAIVGVQNFVDRMAGVAEVPKPASPPPLPLPTIDEQLNTIERGIALLSRLGGLDDRTKLACNDKVRNLLLGNQLALSGATNTDEDREWTISDRVVVLGYPVQRNSVLSAVGLLMAKFYREKHGTEPITRIQYVDGAPRQVKSYRTRDLDILDKAIRFKLGEPPRFGLPPGQ